MTIKNSPARLIIGRYFRYILNVLIVSLVFICFLAMAKELYNISLILLSVEENENSILKKILMFFLYFEFVAMCIKYFEENYHFPLRYLIYIAITGVLRYIMIEHEHLVAAATSILLLVITYVILEIKNKKMNNKKEKPSWEQNEKKLKNDKSL